MLPLRSAKICQPKTEVSPGWPGEYRQPPPTGSCELMMNSMARWAGFLELGVAGEAEAFADRHRGDRMAVHVGHAGRADEQVAVGLLVLDQPLEPAADRLLVLALDRVDIAGAQERQQRQPGRRRVRVHRVLRRGTALPWQWS